MKLLVLAFGIWSASTPAAEVRFPELPPTAVIWNARDATIVSSNELLEALSEVDQLVLGETHYAADVQRAEAFLLDRFSAAPGEAPTLAWEFLNWSQRESIQAAYDSWLAGTATEDEFLSKVLGSNAEDRVYLPLLEVARSRALPLLATNLTREEKKPVVRGGIAALDPRLLPDGFELGSAAYETRFYEAMGGHGDPVTMKNYFAAQCLTDDVIADHLARDLSTERSVLVVGSFHTAYFDGTWARLEARSPGVPRLLIHLEKSESPLSESEQKAFVRDEKYGPIADYVLFF